MLVLLTFVSVLEVVSSQAAPGVLSNRTIGLNDPAVTFSSGWEIGEFNSPFGAQFAFANDLGDEVTVELPGMWNLLSISQNS